MGLCPSRVSVLRGLAGGPACRSRDADGDPSSTGLGSVRETLRAASRCSRQTGSTSARTRRDRRYRRAESRSTSTCLLLPPPPPASLTAPRPSSSLCAVRPNNCSLPNDYLCIDFYSSTSRVAFTSTRLFVLFSLPGYS